MKQSAKTKEERFLLCAYQHAQRAGDLELACDRYLIGQEIGLAERGVNNLFNHLAQANFIRKLGPTEFCLTPNGIALAKRLAGQS